MATGVTVGTTMELASGILIAILRDIPAITPGGASVGRTLALPRDGVVADTFVVTLRVIRAEWFRAVDVAQVRPASPLKEADAGAVVDFGLARTVGAVGSTDIRFEPVSAYRWLGASFEKDEVPSTGYSGTKTFDTEVRTERLQLAVNGGSFDDIKNALAVQLPEVPADLELRIDDAPPIWTSPGPVSEGELPADTPPLRLIPGRPANGATRWRRQSATELVQQIDLADVLSALLGDATAQAADRRESTLILSARVPGAITMDPPANLDDLFWHRARVTEGFVDGRRDVVFPAEGLHVIPLTLPAGASVLHSVSATLAATCDAVRTVPPVGPHAGVLPPEIAPGGAAGVPIAEFTLDAERSLALRLPENHGLETLAAVRVPLRADKSGCEVKAVLLGADVVDPTAPGGPIDGGSGKSVSVEPKPDGTEQWVTLPFSTAMQLPPDTRVFVALHFVRGIASLAVANQTGGAEGVVDVWRGPPTGPWEALPDGAGLSAFRGRLRLTGTAPSDRPIAPVRAAVSHEPSASDGVTPSPKGVPVVLAVPPQGTAELQIEALTPCTVSVRDVVVTVTR